MITNATRINTTLLKQLTDGGLDELQVSIDTINEQINSITRQNTDILRIKEALLEVVDLFPRLQLTFSTVINSLSIFTVQQLLDFGKSLNVKTYIFREVWDFLEQDEPVRNEDYKKWIKKQHGFTRATMSKHDYTRMLKKFSARGLKRTNFALIY